MLTHKLFFGTSPSVFNIGVLKIWGVGIEGFYYYTVYRDDEIEIEGFYSL